MSYPHPHGQMAVRDARAVVLDPHSPPSLRATAWAVLKNARGQRVNQSRIAQMQRAALGLSILTGGAA